jgi:hypothetical protein
MKRLDHWGYRGPYSIAIEAPGHLVCISGLRARHQNRANQASPNNGGALAFVESFREQLLKTPSRATTGARGVSDGPPHLFLAVR